MTIDKHIYFTNEEYLKIKSYADKNSMSFSRAVCELCINALNGTDVLDRLSTIERNVEYIIKKQKIILSLEEQIYSDMDFDNITDPKQSKPLNDFNKKMRNNYIND